MARMKTGRLTPKTTDPKTGARIADPEVYGKKVSEGRVGSWPEARQLYQKEKDRGLKGMEYNPAVKNYLEGKTDKLDDKEFEEPVFDSSVDPDTGRRHQSFYSNYKPGGKGYKAHEARSKSIEGKFYEAPKEGQINQYNSSETMSNITRTGFGSRGTFTDLDQYRKKPVTPPAPAKAGAPPTPTKPEEITFNKLPLPKPTKLTTNTKLAKGKPTKVVERSDFVNPGKSVNRVKVKTGPALTHGKGGGLVKDRGRAGVGNNPRDSGLKAARVVKDTKNIYNRGYNKEEKRFKAYAGTTATGDSFRDMNPGEIKAYREEAKSARAEYRKQPASDLKAMGKAAMTSEIRQSRKAEKFADQKLNLSGNKSVKHFTDKNYGGRIERDYQESTQNAANRNTMDAKLKAIGAKESKRLADIESSTIGGFQYNSPIR